MNIQYYLAICIVLCNQLPHSELLASIENHGSSTLHVYSGHISGIGSKLNSAVTQNSLNLRNSTIRNVPTTPKATLFDFNTMPLPSFSVIHPISPSYDSREAQSTIVSGGNPQPIEVTHVLNESVSSQGPTNPIRSRSISENYSASRTLSSHLDISPTKTSTVIQQFRTNSLFNIEETDLATSIGTSYFSRQINPTHTTNVLVSSRTRIDSQTVSYGSGDSELSLLATANLQSTSVIHDISTHMYTSSHSGVLSSAIPTQSIQIRDRLSSIDSPVIDQSAPIMQLTPTVSFERPSPSESLQHFETTIYTPPRNIKVDNTFVQTSTSLLHIDLSKELSLSFLPAYSTNLSYVLYPMSTSRYTGETEAFPSKSVYIQVSSSVISIQSHTLSDFVYTPTTYIQSASSSVIQTSTSLPNKTLSNVNLFLHFDGDCEPIATATSLRHRFVFKVRTTVAVYLQLHIWQVQVGNIVCGSVILTLSLVDVPGRTVDRLIKAVSSENITVTLWIGSVQKNYRLIKVDRSHVYITKIPPTHTTDFNIRKGDFIAIFVASLVTAIITSLGIGACVRKCKKQRLRSYSLRFGNHMRLNDYTLTRIPRPKTLYCDIETLSTEYAMDSPQSGTLLVRPSIAQHHDLSILNLPYTQSPSTADRFHNNTFQVPYNHRIGVDRQRDDPDGQRINCDITPDTVQSLNVHQRNLAEAIFGNDNPVFVADDDSVHYVGQPSRFVKI